MRIRVNQTSNGHASRYELMCAEHLDERVLHGFVGFGRVAQILIRDPRCAALVERRRVLEPLARRVEIAVLDELANLDRQLRVFGQRGRHGSAGGRGRQPPGGRRRRQSCRRRGVGVLSANQHS